MWQTGRCNIFSVALVHKIDNDLEDSYKEMGERANDVEYWVFIISNNVAICVEYAENGGVVVYK